MRKYCIDPELEIEIERQVDIQPDTYVHMYKLF